MRFKVMRLRSSLVNYCYAVQTHITHITKARTPPLSVFCYILSSLFLALHILAYRCFNLRPVQTIRLRAGPVPWQGRIEVFKNGEWGTVCDSGFDSLDGNVVCRQLGYGSTKTIYSRGGSGRGVGAIHFTQCRSVVSVDHT